jgi:tetratricopeptide (TPR) repeat protein
MEWLVLALNPEDNLGLRHDLMRAYLVRERYDHALDLAARYPDDFAEMRYNRALALYLSGRKDQALDALRDAVGHFPKPMKFLLAADPKRPREDGPGITIGGDEEAWLYRESYLDLWLREGALEWARASLRRKK